MEHLQVVQSIQRFSLKSKGSAYKQFTCYPYHYFFKFYLKFKIMLQLNNNQPSISKGCQRLIEKYIDGSISGKEGKELMKRFEADNLLKQEYELRKALESIVAEREYYLLRQKLNIASTFTIDQSIEIERNPGKANLRKYLYYAAAFTGIAVGGWVTSSILSHKDIDPTKLFLENFEPYPAYRAVRSGSELNSDGVIFKAMLAYQNGDYQNAIIDFKQIVEGNPNSNTIKFYLGISYMELYDFENARVNLMSVAESNSLFKEQALWYCGLCFLGEGNIDEAKSIFIKPSKTDSPLRQKSIALLEIFTEN
jgi:tetratricopeptide (TPR) repeat protein